MPEFPGGYNAIPSYISKNIVYPEKAKKEKIEGRVFVNFIVEKDGKVSDVKVLRGIGGGCDEEAMRVVREMPDWTPGMQDGQAVRVSYNVPIVFALD
jgi:protein TonB